MTKSKIPKLKSRKSHKDTSSSNEDSVSLNEPETEVVEQVSNEAFSEEPDSGETVDSSDIDIDLICRSTIDNVKHMWENQKLKAFSSISKTLMDTSSIQSNLKVVTSESTKQFGSSLLVSASSSNNRLMALQASSDLYNNSKSVVNFRHTKNTEIHKTLGKGWFNAQPLELDDAVKRDLKVIQLRNYLDPKRFYKNPDKGGKVLHVGTVIEGPTEYHSSRLSRKDRKQTILDEVLADQKIKNYTKRTFLGIQTEKSKKRKIFSRKGGHKRQKH